jgi:hypothetical protein
MPSIRRRRPPRPGALADLAPLRILTQILVLQLFYYGIAIVLIVFTTLVEGEHVAPAMIFDWSHIRGDVTTGWTLGLCWMLDSLGMYVFCFSFLCLLRHLRTTATATTTTMMMMIYTEVHTYAN